MDCGGSGRQTEHTSPAEHRFRSVIALLLFYRVTFIRSFCLRPSLAWGRTIHGRTLAASRGRWGSTKFAMIPPVDGEDGDGLGLQLSVANLLFRGSGLGRGQRKVKDGKADVLIIVVAYREARNAYHSDCLYSGDAISCTPSLLPDDHKPSTSRSSKGASPPSSSLPHHSSSFSVQSTIVRVFVTTCFSASCCRDPSQRVLCIAEGRSANCLHSPLHNDLSTKYLTAASSEPALPSRLKTPSLLTLSSTCFLLQPSCISRLIVTAPRCSTFEACSAFEQDQRHNVKRPVFAGF